LWPRDGLEEVIEVKGISLEMLSRCRSCPRHCGADRPGGEPGYCGIGSKALVAHTGLHFGEEPPISGSRGSGAIFFAGCNLRCVFCQNYQISQEFRALGLREADAEDLTLAMLRLQDEGAHNLNLVSPSHVVPQIAEALEAARDRGLAIPVVFNSNGYDSIESLGLLEGLVDVYLPDLKYMDDALAKRLSGAEGYSAVALAAVEEMLRQVGRLVTDEEGVAARGLIVRHLVLPGHIDDSVECLRAIAALDPKITVSIMSQYSPRHRAGRHPEINRTLTAAEYEEIVECALDLGLENAFVQDLESPGIYLPDFTRERPFR